MSVPVLPDQNFNDKFVLFALLGSAIAGINVFLIIQTDVGRTVLVADGEGKEKVMKNGLQYFGLETDYIIYKVAGNPSAFFRRGEDDSRQDREGLLRGMFAAGKTVRFVFKFAKKRVRNASPYWEKLYPF